mgnify:CR=1 FL=1
MVVTWPLLEEVPRSLGLPWASGERPVEDAETIKAMAELARVRVQRLALLSAGAAEGTHRSLSLLVASHKQFLSGEGISLGDIMAGLQKAQSYLDEMAKLRAQKK